MRLRDVMMNPPREVTLQHGFGGGFGCGALGAGQGCVYGGAGGVADGEDDGNLGSAFVALVFKADAHG